MNDDIEAMAAAVAAAFPDLAMKQHLGVTRPFFIVKLNNIGGQLLVDTLRDGSLSIVWTAAYDDHWHDPPS